MGLRHPVSVCPKPTEMKVVVFKFLDARYGVATISRLLQITGLFCKRVL